MSQHTRSNFIMLCLAWICAPNAWADFQPITLRADSYNQDMIVESTAPPPVLAVTTASMDAGALNSGFTWFEQGYINGSPWAGLPPAGSIFTSEQSADHQYRMAQSYQTNNAVLIDAEHPTAVIAFLYPSNYTALSFLTSSGPANNEISYSLLHQDGTRETGKFISPNWYSPLEPAWAANGCVNTLSFTLSDLNSYNPKLYAIDVYPADLNPVIEADLYLSGGTAHTAIFAVSGQTLAGGPFDPVEIAGYNQDMVIEAGALKPGFLETNT